MWVEGSDMGGLSNISRTGSKLRREVATVERVLLSIDIPDSLRIEVCF